MPEEMIVYHCSPTLAGIKTGNLFTTDIEEKEELERQISVMNQQLSKKGVHMILLGWNRNKHPLIYVFRPDQLWKDIQERHTNAILK